MFDALWRDAPEAAFLMDSAGTITMANERMGTLFGYDSTDLVGRGTEVLIPYERRDLHVSLRNRYLEAPNSRDFGLTRQFFALRRDGWDFPVDVALTVVTDADQPLIEVTVRDVSERVRAESALRDAKQAAEQADQVRVQLLGRMSHELRTPLTAILGFTELLQMDDAGPEVQSDFIERIHNAGQRLLTMLNDVLDLSRIQDGSLPLTIETLDVEPVVHDVVRLLAPLADQNGVTVHVDLSEAHLLADANRLKQVLLNLVSNAIKFNHPGGTVEITSIPTSNEVGICIADTGVGIDPQDLPRLFEPFQRLTPRGGQPGGSGIGLALSRSLTTLMDGVIAVDSDPTHGSRFTLYLPVAEAPEQTDAPAADGGPHAERPVTVLCIEDDPPTMVLIERALALRPGVQVVHAEKGRRGVDIARQRVPDLVLLDLNLPDLDGESVLAELKGDSRTRKTPVIVVSADVAGRRIESMLQAGATAYVTKPLSIEDFLRTVDAAVS